MSQPTDILPIEECLVILQRWKKDGATEEEREEFLTKTSRMITDDEMVNQFLEKVAKSAQMAKEINTQFSDQMMMLIGLAIFLIGYTLMEDWRVIWDNYDSTLGLSCELAVNLADILQRFADIYMSQVLTIATQEDLDNAKAALQSFIVELDSKDTSAQIAKQFSDIKADIEEFSTHFSTSANQNSIVPLTANIEALDKLIAQAHKSLGVSEGTMTMSRVAGVSGKASKVIGSLEYYRDKKAAELKDIQQAVEGFTKIVRPSVKAFMAPDIDLILDNLVVFGEIWLAVRSQCVQVGDILQGGLGAATSMGFRQNVKLAQGVSVPLREGLTEYNTQIRQWL
ncbi:hypothetical protein H1R20_g1508, partial [Candolleomyces eurysporus]